MKRYYSFDFLRGLGVFFVIILHTSFYFYKDLYDVDLDNPSLVITIIGFLLMFAGLFAMVSGASHTVSYINKLNNNKNPKVSYYILNGFLILIVAYLYFIFTGPGIIHFDNRSMDESLFVSLINHGKFQSLTFDRLVYIDSLVMIGLNVIFVGLIIHFIKKYLINKNTHLYILIFATLFMLISYIRIPLYNIYLEGRDSNNYFVIFSLNWFVNKNNPIFPFLGFGLFGLWIGLLLKNHSIKELTKWISIVASLYLISGIIGYILAPETMLERAIDPTWYFIMIIQIGLFLFMILISLWIFDFKKERSNIITNFISRFGVAGLTPFFFESIVSALIFTILNLMFTVSLNIPLALLYGISLAILWGFILLIWERVGYKYSIEWLMSKTLSKVGTSTKLNRLGIHLND